MPIESGCTLSTSLGVQGQASLEPDVTLSVALTNRSDLILVEDRHSCAFNFNLGYRPIQVTKHTK